MEDDDTARVVFRRVRADGGGTKLVEEREVRCPPDQLARVMGAPWEAAMPPGETGPGLRRLGEAVGSALEGMRFDVRERRDADGGRRWTLGFVRSEGTEGDEPAESDRPAGDGREGTHRPAAIEDAGGPTVRLAHSAHMRLATDEPGGETDMALTGNVIHVSEQALSLVKYGNAYGILDLTLVVHIHADRGDGDARPTG